MAAPSITFTLATATPEGLLYARLAAAAPDEPEQAQVSFVVDVTNTGASSVTLGELRVGFGGGEHVVAMTDPWQLGTPLVVPPGGTAQWWNQPADNLFLPLPAPAQVSVSVSCQGYSDPVAQALPLVEHESGPTGNGYRFPGRYGDLEPNEYWLGAGGAHGAAGGGNQLFAYDLLAVGADASGQQWSRLVDGADGTQNDHYRIYGKPVYAMADGVVVSGRTDLADNVPGTTAPAVVEGNHLYIRHGAELALYAHFQPGSTPAELLVPGATVTVGQQLGVVGNTGNSTEPHLHVHVIEGAQPWQGPCRPLHFAAFGAQALTELGAAPDDDGWVGAQDNALPRAWSAVRPPRARKIGRTTPTFERVDRPLRRLEEVLVGTTTPGVANGAGGWVILPGGGRKPIDPHGPVGRAILEQAARRGG